MKEYVQITFPPISIDQKEILIAQLSEIGFEAFEEEENILKSFISKNEFIQAELDPIAKQHHLEYTIQKLPATNWNEEWEKNFQPVTVGKFCSVRAEFHAPNNEPKHEIIITPKMSFGTGHHATTYMMIELMEQVDFRDKNVFDFGTGTGILSILSEKLGAMHLVATDIDDWSIENAKENLLLNDCHKVELYKKDNILFDETFNIILANINRNVIIEHLPVICKHLRPNGELLLSGLLTDDFQSIEAEAGKCRLELKRRVERAGWMALKYTLN